jgi:hypothetical protein
VPEYHCRTKKKFSGDASLQSPLLSLDFVDLPAGGAERDRTAGLVNAIHRNCIGSVSVGSANAFQFSVKSSPRNDFCHNSLTIRI